MPMSWETAGTRYRVYRYTVCGTMVGDDMLRVQNHVTNNAYSALRGQRSSVGNSLDHVSLCHRLKSENVFTSTGASCFAVGVRHRQL